MEERDLAGQLRAMQQKLQALEDERDIRDLLCKHDYYFDSMLDEAWLDLWLPEGAFDLVSVVKYPDGSRRELVQRYQGIEELRSFITHPEGHHRAGFYGHSMHTASNNLSIQIDGDAARATSYSLLYQEQDGAVHLLSGANNVWALRRARGAWKILERRRRQAGHPTFATNLELGE